MAIQILEFFDKAGITVRSGDMRRVRMDRLDLLGGPIFNETRHSYTLSIPDPLAVTV